MQDIRGAHFLPTKYDDSIGPKWTKAKVCYLKGLIFFQNISFTSINVARPAFGCAQPPKAGRNAQQEHVQILTDYLVFRQKIIIFFKEFPDNMIIELWLRSKFYTFNTALFK